MANEPTMGQSGQLLLHIDACHPSREQVRVIKDSGIIPLVINADYDKIDRRKILEGFGYNLPPSLGEIFELEINGMKGMFKLLSFPNPDYSKVYSLISGDSSIRFVSSEPVNAFTRKFPVADGDRNICAASNSVFYRVLFGNFGRRWKEVSRYPNIERESLNGFEWLVEVVDDKSKQLDETEEWKSITLPFDCMVYVDTELFNGKPAVKGEGWWLDVDTKILIGKPTKRIFDEEVYQFVPFQFGVQKGFIMNQPCFSEA